MLTIRPFRNEDPPVLLHLWQASRIRNNDANSVNPFLPALTLNAIQSQILATPFEDRRSIMLAFNDGCPAGYVHTSFAPTANGLSLDKSIGQICFLCTSPVFLNRQRIVNTLIQAAEEYLAGQGAQEIFGGSPSPSAPFYAVFYGGSEAIGFLESEPENIRGFLDAGYNIHRKTVCFHIDLRRYEPPITQNSYQWYTKSTVVFNENPHAKSWWEGCVLANGLWFEWTALANDTMRPIARARVRVSCPDADDTLAMYCGYWSASLMDIRVHPDYRNKGVASYLLAEVIGQLIARRQIVQIDAHVAEDSIEMYALLNALHWEQNDTGFIFYKPIR